jgi:Ser/Thr protein kinase RdoA (MazF antagonist)
MSEPKAESFYQLTPHLVLDAIEEQGFLSTGYVTQLNSYENRVLLAHLEDGGSVVAKFYRPGRWSLEAIRDEHEFLLELKIEGIPAVAPLTLKNGKTIASYEGMYMAIFPRISGRSPEEFLGDDLKQVGRRLAQIHNIGSRRIAEHRPTLGVAEYGWPALEILQNWVTPELWNRYDEVAHKLFDFLDDHLRPDEFIRIHGDCHKGNLLQSVLYSSPGIPKDFFFVDFDDFCNGPEVQDFWMLLGVGEEGLEGREQLLKGYEELRDLDTDQFLLFEPLRALRIIHYAAWIARRWEDPSFPKLFPHFNSYLYWLEEIETLERIVREF